MVCFLFEAGVRCSKIQSGIEAHHHSDVDILVRRHADIFTNSSMSGLTTTLTLLYFGSRFSDEIYASMLDGKRCCSCVYLA